MLKLPYIKGYIAKFIAIYLLRWPSVSTVDRFIWRTLALRILARPLLPCRSYYCELSVPDQPSIGRCHITLAKRINKWLIYLTDVAPERDRCVLPFGEYIRRLSVGMDNDKPFVVYVWPTNGQIVWRTQVQREVARRVLPWIAYPCELKTPKPPSLSRCEVTLAKRITNCSIYLTNASAEEGLLPLWRTYPPTDSFGSTGYKGNPSHNEKVNDCLKHCTTTDTTL